MITTSNVNQDAILRMLPQGCCHALSLGWIIHSCCSLGNDVLHIDRNVYGSTENVNKNYMFYHELIRMQLKITELMHYFYLYKVAGKPLPAEGIPEDIRNFVETKTVAGMVAADDTNRGLHLLLHNINNFLCMSMSNGHLALNGIEMSKFCSISAAALAGSDFSNPFVNALRQLGKGEKLLLSIYWNNNSIGHSIAFSRFSDGIWVYDPNFGCKYGLADDVIESYPDIIYPYGPKVDVNLFWTKIV